MSPLTIKTRHKFVSIPGLILCQKRGSVFLTIVLEIQFHFGNAKTFWAWFLT